jgi:hypothetical protein
MHKVGADVNGAAFQLDACISSDARACSH